MDEALDDRCESCGWGRIATHHVTFHDGQAFHVCRPCADEATDRGYARSVRVAHLEVAR
jgi:hypothetical protein